MNIRNLKIKKSKKYKAITFFIGRKYVEYCDECLRWKDEQKPYKEWYEDNFTSLVKEYVQYRRDHRTRD